MKKIFVTLFTFFFLTTSITTSATDNIAEYDLHSQQKEQHFTLLEENGEISYVTITPISKISNGSYEVKYTKPKKWTGKFIVDIKSNKFSSVHSLSTTALSGSIKGYSLKKNSSTKATLEISWKPSVISSTMKVGLKAYISSNTLKVAPL